MAIMGLNGFLSAMQFSEETVIVFSTEETLLNIVGLKKAGPPCKTRTCPS